MMQSAMHIDAHSITHGGVDSKEGSFGLHPKLPKLHSASSEFFSNMHAFLCRALELSRPLLKICV